MIRLLSAAAMVLVLALLAVLIAAISYREGLATYPLPEELESFP